MSGAIATAYVKLIPTFDKQLGSTISKQLGSVDTSKAGSRVGKLFSRGVDSGMSGLKNAMSSRFSAATVALGNIAARAVTGAFSAVASSMDDAIARVDTLNNFPRVMEGMGIAAEDSRASIKRLSDGIDGLPTALDDAVSGVQRFTAKNGDINRSTDYFLAVNNAIAAGGASMQIQSSALEQLSQSYSKGKMDMMEWRSLQQAMPAQLNQIAQAMGTTTDELGEGLRNGNVSMDEFMDKIVELNKEGVEGLDSFEQQARKATGGIGTALTNVRNRVNKAVAGIIDAIGQENISGAINAFSSQFSKIGAIFGGTDADGNVVGFVAGLKDGLAHAFDGWTPELNIDWSSVFQGATEAAQQFGEWLSGPIASFIKTVDEGMAHLGDTMQAAFARLDLPPIDWGAVADGISRVIEVMGDLTFDTIANALYMIADVSARIGEVVGPVLEKMKPGFDSLASSAQMFLEPLTDFFTGVGPAFDGMMERIQGHVDDMSPVLDSLAGHFNSLCEHLEPIASVLGPAVAEILGNIGSVLVGLGTIVLQVVDAIVQAFDWIVQGLNTIGRAVDIAADHFITGWDPLPGHIDPVTGSIEGVGVAVNALPSEKTITISAQDFVSSTIDRIKSKIAEVAGGTVTVAAGGAATGGIVRGSLNAIPTHADGGMSGIVSHPTLTNIGWVGEDGAEAIIPLTNQRYVKPFAQAVASAMEGSRGEVHNHYTIGEMTVPAGSALAAAMDAVFSQAQALQAKGAA